MLGAIAGDIIGSIYERNNIKTTEFPLFQPSSHFTDDTVLTVALAESILHGKPFVDLLKEYYRAYPHAGYGGSFHKWAQSKGAEPYNSWGNGSAMRVSPVGLAFGTLETVLVEAKKSAEVTHNHPEGVKGAQAIASAVFLARTGQSNEQIKNYIEKEFGYHLDTPLDEIRKTYEFQVSCQESVPQAIRAFLESTGFEDAVRRAISIGGDSDTIASMAGAIAEARAGGIPAPIRRKVYDILDGSLCRTTREFVRKFGQS
jgi:ADP-ribosylglycohydrolase